MDVLVWVSVASSVGALIMVTVLMLRQKAGPATEIAPRLAELAAAGERFERLMREESARNRDEAVSRAKELRDELTSAHARVQTLIDDKLSALGKITAEGQRALREEVHNNLARLGAGIGENITRLGDLQRERLEAVAKEIGALTQRHGDEQAALRKALEAKLGEMRTDASLSAKGLREEVTNTLKHLNETLIGNINLSSTTQKERLEQVAKEIAALTQKHEQAQEGLRKTVEARLDVLRQENGEKLETIRKTVDEQLQGTLEKRLGESFKLVSERLEQVHKGLGEMQSLATGVGDLKRVLTNVKARGTWGEVQLGSLLEQILTPEQYKRDAVCRPGSLERVEYAIRLPGRDDGESEVLLPIDAKFPQEDYERLMLAADRADTEALETAGKQLEQRVRAFAKEIRDKYINPPHTTDFAILFLPTEGLYAELLRRPGLVEQIQRECRVSLAGPTTLAATLNALQMGFRTLAIQKRSSEVWQVLEAVKSEFGKYGVVLDKVHKKLQEASKSIDEVAVRRRAIDRKLRAVGTLPEDEATTLLGLSPVALDGLTEEESAEA